MSVLELVERLFELRNRIKSVKEILSFIENEQGFFENRTVLYEVILDSEKEIQSIVEKLSEVTL
ncbi:hypothetical protein [Alkalihalobacillus pseudalcaliphilus]|uniref:hypothetical protein n=1 Tax=Alkalihalobacillus pseudalcaliphilus TaxID=79884 RepID=UPI00064DDEB2|nr:hypothetical protein [Alkalihalobacillus pseudalcaliphilus]KMK75426.1 hypothetical protein AB990_08910 [Alkalihalobacillus pseudalcaliphilus]